jgi:hypothetical protein
VLVGMRQGSKRRILVLPEVGYVSELVMAGLELLDVRGRLQSVVRAGCSVSVDTFAWLRKQPLPVTTEPGIWPVGQMCKPHLLLSCAHPC